MKLIKFSASWCGPCSTMTAMLDKIDADIVRNRINIDIDEQPDMSLKYKIRSIPTMIVVDNTGKEISRLIGSTSDLKIKEWLGV